MLGRRIAARPRPPATVRDLEIALLEEWNSIPKVIDNLIASMANRFNNNCLEKRSQTALDLLQNLPSESSAALTHDSLGEDVPENYLPEFR
ncbi:hypothetical protein TNCV_2006681 [Trichonephila clavipes]|nr:hypothetical protein TNCV_2006681 [Trichonephila clavipes]